MDKQGWHFGGPLILFFFLLLLGSPHAGLKWVFHADSAIVGTPIIRNGLSYSLSEGGTLYVLGLSSGSQEYFFALPDGTTIAPSMGRTYLILATNSGAVEALNIDAGKRAWQYGEGFAGANTGTFSPGTGIADLPGGATGTGVVGNGAGSKAPGNTTLLGMVASGGYVFLSYPDKVVSLDETTGREVWIRPLNGGGQIAADSSMIYVVHGNKLAAMEKLSGATKWDIVSGYVFGAGPSAVDGKNRVFVANTQGQILALDSRNGMIDWNYQTRGWAMSTPAQIGSTVVFGTNANEVVALDANSGSMRWSAKVLGPVWSKPAGAGEGMAQIAIVGANDYYIHAYDIDTGEEVWKYPTTDWAFSGATADGNDFVAGSQDGEIWALSASPMCTISNLRSGQIVGEKFEVSGSAYAARGVGNVRVTVGKIEYPRISGKTNWTVSVDASPLPDGDVEIRCTTTDVSGLEENDRAPKLVVVKSLAAQRQKMTFTLPAQVEPGAQVMAYVRDADGFDLDNVGFEIGDSQNTSRSPYTFKAPSSDGDYKITATKYGYENAVATLSVRTNIFPIAVLALIVVGGLAIAIVAVLRITKKR